MSCRLTLSICISLILPALAEPPTGTGAELPLLDSLRDLPTLREKANASKRVLAVDLMQGTEGALLDGASASRLPAGRYRLHLSLSINPLGHPLIRDYAIVVRAGAQELALDSLDFAKSEEPVHFIHDFVSVDRVNVPVTVKWELGERARMSRAKADTPSLPKANIGGPPAPAEEGEEDLILEFEQEGDGTVTLGQAQKIEFRLCAHFAAIVPLGQLAVTQFHADKLLYEPGERGNLSLTVRNYSRAPATDELSVELVRELSDTTLLDRRQVAVPPLSNHQVRVPFTATGRWGTAVRATIGSGPSSASETYFSVSDNFYEVGIGYGTPVHTDTKRYLQHPEHMRANYLNWLDVFFWAPCDWACLVSPLKRWWGGQCDYPHDEDNLKDLIVQCHRQGIKLAAYCSKNAAGPFGWEVARRHPEWFARSPRGGIAGSYHVEHLDRWNDEDWRASDEEGGYRSEETRWYGANVDLRRVDALDYGIDQIVKSVKHYGWDAVRFDGHYTIVGNDAVSTRNMRRLKERVWKELPNFRFGFNYGCGPEWHGGITHEMREALAGGGMYMQEGIRNWRHTDSQYSSWKHYASNELRIAKQLQTLGGTYHCIWSLQGLTRPQAFYKFVYGLVAGGHPCYGSFVGLPGCENWGAFMTRWSSMLWDPGLRAVPNPEQRFAVRAEGVQWQPFVQERVGSEERKFVVLHLVKPPPDDAIAKTEFPLAPLPLTVQYTPEGGTRIKRVVLVRPERSPFEEELPVERSSGRTTVRVPKMRLWALLVWEVEGKFTVPSVPPRFTEPPDPAQVAEAEKRALITRTDPNKAALTHEAAPGVIVHLLNHGSANIGKPLTFDPDSDQGTVHWRDKSRQSATLGSYWFEEIPPGEHRISLSFKWTDALEKPTPQKVSVQVINEHGDGNPGLTLVTPGYPSPPEGAKSLGERGKYQYYGIGTFKRTDPRYIHVVCQATTSKVGDNALYLDKIKVETVGGGMDRDLAKFYKLAPKPDGLRVPNGAKPQHVLFVKGMFWEPYLAKTGLDLRTTYSLPVGHEELYAYDCVVLCNIDFMRMKLPRRKLLKDFVEDGGRLVFLGGCFTLGQGGVLGTFLDEILPVTCAGPYEVAQCDPPLLLGPSHDKIYADRPALFWRHRVTPRPDATVLAWAGSHPISVSGRAGKGIVRVFAGTTLGQGSDQLTPFWETASWQRLLQRMVYGEE